MSKPKYIIDTGFEDTRFEEYERLMREHLKARALSAVTLRDLDAEVNGGILVQVAVIMGNPIYMRVNHHDTDAAKAQLKEVRSIVKDVVVGE